VKGLFLTTSTSDCINHVRAWESAFGPAEHVTFNHEGIRNDQVIIDAVKAAKPDVIFYIGAMKGLGNPRVETYHELRSIAPTINFCSDASDRPWHPVLATYARMRCFDLQVGIDGPSDAPVDLSTLTPVDTRPFDIEVEKDIRFGFSGSVGKWNGRSEIVKSLEWFGGLEVRHRESGDTYTDHVRYLRRCQMVLNISLTGSGHRNHIKGRVLESGWAGCALLESEGSPIGNWFPSDCYMIYRDPKEAADIVRDIDDATIDRMARRLSEEVRTRYHPKMIYMEMLKRAMGTGRGAIKQYVDTADSLTAA
jgi:hypothetical protein